MSGKNKKQYGVWMDSHHATITGRENIDNGDFVIIGHVNNEVQIPTPMRNHSTIRKLR